MRRFLTLVVLMGLAIPAGVTLSGCTRNPAAKYCPGFTYGRTITDVASITLQPQIAGISLAYGQTIQAQTPSAITCTGATATVSSKSYTYGTTNNQLVDISPTGAICAGTWNRNTGGGIANYTFCNYPNPLPSTNGLPYGIGYITAAADSVTSNPVAVYVHAPVTSITLAGPSGCQSQGTVTQLDAAAYYALNGTQTLLCAPNNSSVPDCEDAIGTMSFTVGTASVASINASTNQITAEQPGTTAITASIAGSGSSAGFFSTCPPASISVTLANGGTSGTIAQGVAQSLTTTATDTNGNPLTGLTLTFQSTNPIEMSASSSGAITTSFPGTGAITAVCQPATCNPAPINEVGLNGSGLPISSNPVTVTIPGTASDFAWFAAPGQSQYFVPVELLTGVIGSNVRMPYVPNSMMMDGEGSNLYFGTPRELMIYSTSTDTLTKQDPTAPGVVLAVSPNNSQLLINDQARQLFYLYNASSGSSTTFGGMGVAAAWTPDSQTLYIVDNAEMNTPSSCPSALISGHTDTLYVYNANTGWTTEPLPPSPLPASAIPSCTTAPNTVLPLNVQTPAITVPGVGAYLRGNPTVAHTWCPTGTVGNNGTIQFYPLGDSEPVQSDVLGATVDGQHILSASATAGGGITFNDIAVTIPTGTGATNSAGTTITPPIGCPSTTSGTAPNQVQTLGALAIHSTYTQTTIPNVSAAAVDQVVTGSVPQVTASQTVASGIAFVTYTPSSSSNTNALLPYYIPAAGGAAGALNYVTFSGGSAVSAPLVGALSPDNTIFFVSTAGDNKIHYISIPTGVNATTPPTDTQQVSPNLPACTSPANGGVDAGCTYNGTGTIVPVTAIEVKPRSTT
jgi:trimeric autotransporter adhesin